MIHSVVQLLLLVLPLTVEESCMTLPVLSTTQLVFMRPFQEKGSTILRYLKSPTENSQAACGHKCCTIKEEQCHLAVFKKDTTVQEPNCFLYVCSTSKKCRVLRYTDVATATAPDTVVLGFVDDHPVIQTRKKREAPTNNTNLNPAGEPITNSTVQSQAEANISVAATPIQKTNTNVPIPATTQQSATAGNEPKPSATEKQASPVQEADVTSGNGQQLIATTPGQQNAVGNESNLENSPDVNNSAAQPVAQGGPQEIPQEIPEANSEAIEATQPIPPLGNDTNNAQSGENQTMAVSTQGTTVTAIPQSPTGSNATTPELKTTTNMPVNTIEAPVTPGQMSTANTSSLTTSPPTLVPLTTTPPSATQTTLLSNTTLSAGVPTNTSSATLSNTTTAKPPTNTTAASLANTTTSITNTTTAATLTDTTTAAKVPDTTMQPTTAQHNTTINSTIPIDAFTENQSIPAQSVSPPSPMENSTTAPYTALPVTTTVPANATTASKTTTTNSNILTTQRTQNITEAPTSSPANPENVTDQSASSTHSPEETPASDVTKSSSAQPPTSSNGATNGWSSTVSTTLQPIANATGNSTMMNSNSTVTSSNSIDPKLIAVLIGALSVGMIFFVAVIVLVSRRVYESWQRRHYSRIDYLVNGMYN